MVLSKIINKLFITRLYLHSIGFFLIADIMSNTKYTEEWRKLKSFLMSSLRTHGFGTQKSEENIMVQLDKLCDVLENKSDTPLSDSFLKETFMQATTSVLLKIIADQSYELDDPDLLDLIEMIKKYQALFFEASFVIVVMGEMLPLWMNKLLFPKVFKRARNAASGIRNVLMKHLKVGIINILTQNLLFLRFF